MYDLTGKVAVITGGAGLLGMMHAEAIAEAGGSVALLDINSEQCVRAALELQKVYGDRAIAIHCDVTSKSNVQQALSGTLERFGRIDILINNAAFDSKMTSGGTGKWTRFENFSLDDWNREIEVGLTGAFICCQIIGKQMADNHAGVILNISSDLGIVSPDQRLYQLDGTEPENQPTKPASYSVVKTGLIGLTRFLATYWAPNGVRVNALCPGGVKGDMPPAFVERVTSRIPMGRMANKSEYKGAVLFMVSDASTYMTGAVIVVDGGRTCW